MMKNPLFGFLLVASSLTLSTVVANAQVITPEQANVISTSLIAQSQLQTDELINPEWVEVTYPDYPTVYINGANIERSGNLVIFDTVDDDGKYVRLEGNCASYAVRDIRQGDFLSATTVSYLETNGSVAEASAFVKVLIDMACSLEQV